MKIVYFSDLCLTVRKVVCMYTLNLGCALRSKIVQVVPKVKFLGQI